MKADRRAEPRGILYEPPIVGGIFVEEGVTLQPSSQAGSDLFLRSPCENFFAHRDLRPSGVAAQVLGSVPAKTASHGVGGGHSLDAVDGQRGPEHHARGFIR